MAMAGRVAIVPKDGYSATVSYKNLDMVRYSNNVYVAKKASTGVLPINTDCWMLCMENVTQEQYDALVSGTTPVGDSNKLGGKGAREYALQSSVDKIQTYSARTFGPNGNWFRIAYREGNSQIFNNSCFISLKKTSSQSESHLIRLEATNGGARFNAISSKTDIGQAFASIRYTYDSLNTYIEVRMYGIGPYGFTATLFDIVNSAGTAWKKLDFEETSETVEGVAVVATYDIPTNARQVNDYEIYNKITWNQLTPDKIAGTYYYVESFSNGTHNLTLNRPDVTWARMQLANGSIAGHKIYVRIVADNELCAALEYAEEDNGSLYMKLEYAGKERAIITMTYNYLAFHFSNYWATHTSAQLKVNAFDLTLMFGAGNEPSMEEFDRMFPDEHYEYNTGIELDTVRAQTVKLNEYIAKNYLSKNGGEVSASEIAPFKVDRNNNETNVYIEYSCMGKILGQLGFNDKDTPYFRDTEGGLHKLLHTGNVGDYAVPLIKYETQSYVQFKASDDGLLGFLGMRAWNVPAFVKSDGATIYDLLHTGNSAKVVQATSAPSDATAVWVDTTNKVIKSYIDGAWTQVS